MSDEIRDQINDIIEGEIQNNINEYIEKEGKGFKGEELKVNVNQEELNKLVKVYKKLNKYRKSSLFAVQNMDNTEKIEYDINPKGGFKHFGNVNGDFIILRGSVPGTYKRLIKLRAQIRNAPSKIIKPNILEVIV